MLSLKRMELFAFICNWYDLFAIHLQARASLIDKQYEADREKLHKIRLLLVRIAIWLKS